MEQVCRFSECCCAKSATISGITLYAVAEEGNARAHAVLLKAGAKEVPMPDSMKVVLKAGEEPASVKIFSLANVKHTKMCCHFHYRYYKQIKIMKTIKKIYGGIYTSETMKQADEFIVDIQQQKAESELAHSIYGKR